MEEEGSSLNTLVLVTLRQVLPYCTDHHPNISNQNNLSYLDDNNATLTLQFSQ